MENNLEIIVRSLFFNFNQLTTTHVLTDARLTFLCLSVVIVELRALVQSSIIPYEPTSDNSVINFNLELIVKYAFNLQNVSLTLY